MASIEADIDETEEVEFISVCYIFPKFKMHCIKKKNKSVSTFLIRGLHSSGRSRTGTGMY